MERKELMKIVEVVDILNSFEVKVLNIKFYCDCADILTNFQKFSSALLVRMASFCEYSVLATQTDSLINLKIRIPYE